MISQSIGCTLITASASGMTLVGMNKDGSNTLSTISLFPRGHNKHAKVIFGFSNEFDSGMNEHGLMCGLTSTPPAEVVYSTEKKKFENSPWLALLDCCITVKDVVDLLDEFNLTGLETKQALIADQLGNAAILGVGKDKHINVMHKEDWYYILTNFNQFQPEAGNYPCYRYELVSAMLTENPTISLKNFRNILSVTHNEGSNATVYSIIFDLPKQDLYLYYYHDFGNCVKFNLQQALEMEKVECSFLLPSLFPNKRKYYAEVQAEKK